ncbi:MAG: hypothetical protein O3A14_09830 [Cyanobacteria bacterium]|nr:hypothetical protein [Cyanobacteriota bacterium]
MEPTISTEIDYAAQINDLLDALNASTDYNPYSGLMAENVEGSEAVVKIFDDYSSGEYYADQAIEALKKEEPIDWDAHDNTESAQIGPNADSVFGPIWDAISGCEV